MKLSPVMFNEYTLTFDDYLYYAIVFSFVIVTIFITSKSLLSTPKQFSWIISLMNSTIMTIIAMVYIAAKSHEITPVLISLSTAVHIFHARNDFCSLACLWFGVANIWDILLGLLFYPKYLQLLTGYIHHTVYIWIMVFSITGNGGIATSRPFSPCFIFAGLEEIPTFLLALGSMFPSYRTDMGFGLTFFVLRIVFHIFLLGYSIYSKCDTATAIIYGMTLTLHIHWFSTWISKYGSSSEKKIPRKEGKKAA